MSGLGKGISISSLGVLLKASGLRVTAVKVDPYLNYDAGYVQLRNSACREHPPPCCYATAHHLS